ncbi:MAG: glycosyltransferase family 4 protein [Planctomycetota bacterium]|jgi:glycosyltransferase involved in cell wall biosynthesis
MAALRPLVVVTNLPTPYRVPLFNTLDRQLRSAGWELEVVFGSRSNQRRRWRIAPEEYGFRHHFLEGRNLRLGRERIVNTYTGLARLLEARGPAGIICTGYSAGTMAAARYARRAQIPLAIWSGTTENVQERAWWRRFQRRRLVGRSDAFLAYGTEAREYLLGLGAPADRVHIAWNTVDTSRFERLAGAHSPSRYEPLRLLTVGYLERRKRVDRAIRAVAAAVAQGLDVTLDVAGEGSERPALEELARECGVADRVRFLGYQDYDALQPVYAGAHAFLFTTARDIWGLVLVEAMAAGLPCIASTRAGATRDLVLEEETGYAVDFDDTDAVVDRLARLRSDPGRIEYMGNEARNRIRDHFTLDHSGRSWVKVVRQW